MIAAAEGALVGSAPRERGWRWLVLALVAAAVVTVVPHWPPSLSLLGLAVQWSLPLAAFGLMVVAGIGACAVASWARGGKTLPAVLVVLALGLWIWRFPPTGGLTSFQAGWSLLVAAAFGATCVVSGSRHFLGRALEAVGVAGLVTMLLLTVNAAAPGQGVRSMAAAFSQELDNRRDAALEVWQQRVRDRSWVALGERFPAVVAAGNRTAQRLAESKPPSSIVPALLVLETLAALALAWTTWHRLTRARLGPPLAPLSQFRFNDQLVWGLVVGATMVLLPSLEGWYTAGVNLLVVFGALHALRGLAVLVWWLPDRWAAVPLLVVLLAVPLLGPVLVLATVAVLALGLGLGDTWRDFRRSAQPLRTNARP